MIEDGPIKQITKERQLSVFKHKGFWQRMDTYRDNQLLERMWCENPKWKIWQ